LPDELCNDAQPLLRVDAKLRFLSCEPLLTALPGLSLDGIGWIIGGGQSGRGAAVCNADWMRALRDLCLAHDVPFLLKQWGSWASNPTPRELELDPKAKGGATLDGRLWREWPRRTPSTMPAPALATMQISGRQ
jgi:protein gp37